MSKTREFSFDILRVVSMCMVIIVHVANVYSRSYGIIGDDSFVISLGFNTISRISVPIFLMISGALLLDRKFDKTKYFKRLIKFLFLIIVWDIIYLVWEWLYLGITYDHLERLLFEPYRAHLWYLYTILVLYAIQPLLKLLLDKSNNAIKYIVLMIWFTLSSLSIVNSTLASIFTIFSYIGFFIIGKYLYDFIKNNNLKKYNTLWILIIILCVISSIYLNYSFSHRYIRFYNLFFAYRTPFIILSSVSFYILVVSNYTRNMVPKVIETLSDVSFGVYLIHGLFLDVTIKIFNYQRINALIGIPAFFLIILIFSTTSVLVIKKIKIVHKIIE